MVSLSGRWKVQMTASKLARKKQDNEIFDAKMKKKESERYWRAKDCRPPRRSYDAQKNKSSNLSQLVKLYQDLPARIQEILVNHRETADEWQNIAEESEESEEPCMIED